MEPEIYNVSRYTVASRYYCLLKIANIVFPRYVLDELGFSDPGVGHWLVKGRYLSKNNYNKLFYEILSLVSIVFVPLFFILSGICNLIIKRMFPEFGLKICFLIVFLCFVVGGVGLQFKYEMLTAPNMFGVFLVFCLLVVSFLASTAGLIVWSSWQQKRKNITTSS